MYVTIKWNGAGTAIVYHAGEMIERLVGLGGIMQTDDHLVLPCVYGQAMVEQKFESWHRAKFGVDITSNHYRYAEHLLNVNHYWVEYDPHSIGDIGSYEPTLDHWVTQPSTSYTADTQIEKKLALSGCHFRTYFDMFPAEMTDHIRRILFTVGDQGLSVSRDSQDFPDSLNRSSVFKLICHFNGSVLKDTLASILNPNCEVKSQKIVHRIALISFPSDGKRRTYWLHCYDGFAFDYTHKGNPTKTSYSVPREKEIKRAAQLHTAKNLVTAKAVKSSQTSMLARANSTKKPKEASSSKQKMKSNTTVTSKSQKVQVDFVFSRFAMGMPVHHNQFHSGVVIDVDRTNQMITVDFDGMPKKFIYPRGFGRGVWQLE